MKQLPLAWRFLWRDARSGELTILLLALLTAITSTTAISLFADRLQRTMTQQAADFMAADMVISSPEPVPQHWLKKARQLSLQQAQAVEFSSVLIENGEMLLAGIKAVDKHYPLHGFLKVRGTNNQEDIRHSGPAPGKAWVEPRILSALKLTVGDTLTVGEKPLVITQILSYEPDKRGDLYSLSPRVMINHQDLTATRVIQPGSHVHYFFQFTGSTQALLQFKRWVKPHLNPSQRLMDIHEDRPELGSALKRAERYLGLSSIIVVLISGVAIAMTSRRYAERHFNTTAILRCLGLTQSRILILYISQFLLIGLLASLAGGVFGWLAQQGLFHLLRDLLPAQVSEPGFFAIIFGFVTGLGILFGFSLPPLLRLKHVPPLRVLRQDLEPLPASAWLVYGLAFTLITLLIWQYTDDLKMTLTLLGSGLLMITLLAGLIILALTLSRRLVSRLSLSARIGFRHLVHSPRSSVTQIMAFTITLVAMLVILTVRTSLLDDWQKQLPDNAPNHFALNIFPDQIPDFTAELKQQNIQTSQFYPVVRGRLIKINGIAVQKIVSKDSQGERATHRDLSLTWAEKIPETNTLAKGQWWHKPYQKGLVSVEEKLAKSLKIKLNDHLLFTLGSQPLEAVVSNIRTVQWDTMKPNFYFIFTPGTLENHAHTYITSFYLPPEKKNYLNTLIKHFPATTILEVDQILKQFKSILKQLTEAINFLLYFALLAGFTVLYAAILATLDNRIYESVILRTLGANRKLLRTAHFLEFLLLGFISAMMAILLSETILFCLYRFVLHLQYTPQFERWLITLVAGSLFIASAGFWGTRKVTRQAPAKILREI